MLIACFMFIFLLIHTTNKLPKIGNEMTLEYLAYNEIYITQNKFTNSKKKHTHTLTPSRKQIAHWILYNIVANYNVFTSR